MSETTTSPDTLADALMELIDQAESKPGGESAPSQEGQQSEGEQPPAQATQEPETPIPPVDDFETRYSARRQQEAAEEQRTSNATALMKLLEEGDPEEVGKLVQEQFTQLKVTTAAEQGIANRIFDQAIDPEFVKGLTDEEAVELHGYTQKFEVPKFIQRVTEIKARSMQATDIDTLVERKVQEQLQAAQNAQRGNQLRQPSPTSVPPASSTLPVNQSSDDLWAAGLEEIAESQAMR